MHDGRLPKGEGGEGEERRKEWENNSPLGANITRKTTRELEGKGGASVKSLQHRRKLVVKKKVPGKGFPACCSFSIKGKEDGVGREGGKSAT